MDKRRNPWKALMEKKLNQWQFLIIYYISVVLGAALFLFTRYKLRGYIFKIEWIIAILLTIIVGTWMTVKTLRIKKDKGTGDTK